jgi:hypothetical protein
MKNNEKFLREGYSIEAAVKETRESLAKEKVLEKIVINGLVFNKLKDEL